MCTLTTVITSDYEIGYKVVAEDDNGKRYSIAMGFCYDDYDRIPVIEEQKQIGKFFVNNLLSKGGPFFRNMIGRTAIFKNIEDAIDLYGEMYNDSSLQKSPFEIKLYKAMISEDLMEGYYDELEIRVVAGRKIKFLSIIRDDSEIMEKYI